MRKRSPNYSKPLTAEFLRHILRYEPETGNFFWENPPSRQTKSGSLAGTRSTEGYWQISIYDRLYRAHRLAWFYTHGDWPANVIDHINGDRTNNSLSNLRDVTQAENLKGFRSRRFVWSDAPVFHF